jgi:hypothetical protein
MQAKKAPMCEADESILSMAGGARPDGTTNVETLATTSGFSGLVDAPTDEIAGGDE